MKINLHSPLYGVHNSLHPVCVAFDITAVFFVEIEINHPIDQGTPGQVKPLQEVIDGECGGSVVREHIKYKVKYQQLPLRDLYNR
jgi:hypothetical protein